MAAGNKRGKKCSEAKCLDRPALGSEWEEGSE
jgi:hypothetical protein